MISDRSKTMSDFKKNIPIRDYEDLKPYIEQVLEGKADVLWKGKPEYFAKTSGTTSGTKYIPITKDSVPNHINSARNALLSYVHETGNASFLDGGLIFLSGSPVLNRKGRNKNRKAFRNCQPPCSSNICVRIKSQVMQPIA